MNKTNALRSLDSARIPYEVREYDPKGPLDALSVADALQEPRGMVFKTLVTVSDRKRYYVFCAPADRELDLKKCARAAGEKSVQMIRQKELLPLTGYVHGGCSPVGMKKLFPTWIHQTAEGMEKIYVSAGRIGMQMGVCPEDLRKLVRAEYADIVRDE